MERGNSAGRQAARKRDRMEDLRTQLDRAERDAARWQRGSEGEQLVAAELERLSAYGFDVFHDVHWPGRQRANIDHVAVGPPGILVVDAKNWSGKVTVRDGILRQNGFSRDSQVEGARQAAQDVGSLLQLPWALHTMPVIALAGASTGSVDQCQGVTVLGLRDLVGWVISLEPRLSPDDVHGIASHLRSAMPSASLPAPRARSSFLPSAPAPPRVPSARVRKRMERRAAARREALLKLAALVLVLLSAPALVHWWTTHGDAVVRAAIPTPTFSVTAPAASAGAAPAFTTCRTLRAAYPDGVKRAGATNTGKKARGHVVVNDAAYRANRTLDRDKDGIACERTRSAARHGR